MINKLKVWAKRLKRDLIALDLAQKDKNLPWYINFLIVFTIAYALSPVDLIPDFIPVVGIIDDIIIILLLIYFIIHLIPEETLLYYRRLAEQHGLSGSKNWFAGVIILLIWVVIFLVVVNLLLKLYR